MFERYTEKARRVIFFARYEASQFGAAAIGPEHLLLGLMREDKTLTSRFIARSEVSLNAIRREIEKRAPFREKHSTTVELPLAADTKRVLQHAHEESDRLQHRYIGTEHLLVGLLKEERSVAAEILYERGLRLAAVREEIGRASGNLLDSEEAQPPFPKSLPRSEKKSLGSFFAKQLGDLSERLRQLGTHAEAFVHSVESSPHDDAPSIRTNHRTILGLEKLLTERLDLVRGARVGLVCNQASVDHQLRHAADLSHEHPDINLTALFGPQHGIRGDVQDNMVETPHTVDRATKLPVYSLYSETREPTEEMLAGVDTLVFDMQDVGCRIYTFIYTLANCMRAARRYGKRVIVCDRPNPINGEQVAGTLLEPAYESFVGQFAIPTRHGMTVGELAGMFNKHWKIGCDLEVVVMEGWGRDQWFDETDAPWVMPSPNIPTPETAIVFPGTVHIEGTQMSEGRGTTRPFEIIGAPYIEAAEYARQLRLIGFPGITFRACNFQPTFQKHANRPCGGVQLHVTDRRQFEPVIVGVALIKIARDLYAEEFCWKEPPYEYVFDRNPFDIIAGTGKLRERLERGDNLHMIEASWQDDIERFREERAAYLLY